MVPLCILATMLAGCSGAGNTAGLSATPITPTNSSIRGTIASIPGKRAATSGAIPKHVLTYLYYGQSFGSVDVNANLSASYMAAHATFVETSGYDNTRLNNFKAAGGQFGVTYIDPSFVPYCVPPFTAPAGACAGQIGNLNPPEDSWFHGADGSRVRRADSYTNEYQEFLNPASPDAQKAIVAWMNGYIANSPALDMFFSDDSGSNFTGPDGTAASGMFYGFNTVGTEITTDAAWMAGEEALWASEPRKVILNGGDGFAPAYGGKFLQATNVAGSNHEGCFNSSYWGGAVNDASGVWESQANGLLGDIPFGKYSLCMMNGAPTVPARIYALASWWLTYQPATSVAAPIAPASDGNAVFPEFDIVPLEPKTTAGTNITALATGGVYVREFAQCYQDGVSIGACAAIVNPTTSTKTIPVLSRSYSQELVLNAESEASGGTATWTAIVSSNNAFAVSKARRPNPKATPTPQPTTAPTKSLGTLGPVDAIILRQ